jgi:ATP-binding cassette subfamily C protein LapB
MYDADSGKILIGGISVSDISTISLRKTVGYCEQPAALYNASIRDNILCGQQWTDEEVERVLRRTGFDLSRYSLDMMVGEGGKSLSGGESQRISITRMLIRKPQILVLDEPTAFADADGTECVMNILRE